MKRPVRHRRISPRIHWSGGLQAASLPMHRTAYGGCGFWRPRRTMPGSRISAILTPKPVSAKPCGFCTGRRFYWVSSERRRPSDCTLYARGNLADLVGVRGGPDRDDVWVVSARGTVAKSRQLLRGPGRHDRQPGCAVGRLLAVLRGRMVPPEEYVSPILWRSSWER